MLHCHNLKPAGCILVGASHKLSWDNTICEVLQDYRDIILRKGLSLSRAGSLPNSGELKGDVECPLVYVLLLLVHELAVLANGLAE